MMYRLFGLLFMTLFPCTLSAVPCTVNLYKTHLYVWPIPVDAPVLNACPIEQSPYVTYHNSIGGGAVSVGTTSPECAVALVNYANSQGTPKLLGPSGYTSLQEVYQFVSPICPANSCPKSPWHSTCSSTIETDYACPLGSSNCTSLSAAQCQPPVPPQPFTLDMCENLCAQSSWYNCCCSGGKAVGPTDFSGSTATCSGNVCGHTVWSPNSPIPGGDMAYYCT